MKNIVAAIIILAGISGVLTSCSKSAKCECTTTVNGIMTEKVTIQSAGKDPTCNDFESTETEDSITTVIECIEL